MDSDSELARAKWMLIALGLFVLGGCLSWGELIYLVSSKDALADVTQAREVSVRGRRSWNTRTKLAVDYQYTDVDGAHRTGSDTVGTDWPVAGGGKVTVRFTPGPAGRSRLAGHVNWVGVGLFAASLAAIAGAGVKLYLEANEAYRPRKPRRRERDW